LLRIAALPLCLQKIPFQLVLFHNFMLS
jgi:hypothetical protein